MRIKKTLYIAAAALVFLGMLLPFELRFLKLGEFFPETLLYLVFFNLNLIVLLALIYMVSKGFIELYQGVKRKTIGFKFRAKILLLFAVLSITPMVMVYVVASGLATNYMDKIFNTQFREPLISSLAMAHDIYQEEKARALEMADSALGAVKTNSAGPYKIEYLPRLPADATPAMAAAFHGERGSEVLSTSEGDIIRAEIPRPGGGVIVASTTLPPRLASYAEAIRRANESLMKLETWRTPIRTNFYLVLGFIALTIMFTALLAALKLARGITEPVSGLAAATREVARGNLDLKLVIPGGSDEMGLLIDSFNRMVAELKEGKESLESAYQESDRRRLCMEGILDNIRSGVISLSPEGFVLTINPRACAILGISGPEVVARPYETLLSHIESDELKILIKGINVRTIKFVEQELWVGIGKSRERALLRVFITGLRDAKGRHMGLLAVFDDLTELVRAQRALAWQEVARRIAHEIKNPLTPIKLSTERMMKKWAEGHADFPSVFERSTRTIIAEVESLRGLVDEFSRLGRMPDIKKRPSDLPDLIEEVKNLYRVYKDFQITVEAPAGLPAVELDPEQFRRVLVNIIDNAREAMNNSGVVSVKIEADAETGRLFMKISDTGPGIPPEVREKLFEPYFSTKKHGTGLGLAIVHKIISEHNGFIRISENSPNGSAFEIELPLRES